MTDQGIVEQCLRDKGYAFKSKDGVFTITSGPLNKATIDTRDGTIKGDTDFRHDEKQIGALQQDYAVWNVKMLIQQRSGTLISQEKCGEDIVIRCQVSSL